MKNLKTLQIALCGPGDVLREIEIAKEVVAHWNQQNFDSLNCGLHDVHWSTDVAPSMKARGQSVINSDMIEKSDILVAIFWQRLGTATGMHDSGTVEEILHAIALKKPVMLYFSDLENTKSVPDADQQQRLNAFRNKAIAAGLPWKFQSRRQFKQLFTDHLHNAVTTLLRDAKKTKAPATKAARTRSVKQTATGTGNVQVAGDNNTFKIESSKAPRITVTPPPGSVTPAELQRISQWIEELAILMEEVRNMTTAKAKGELWNRLKYYCKVTKYEQIASSQMPSIRQWVNIVQAELMDKAKTKSPQVYSSRTIPLIKAAMGRLGRTNTDYYPEIAARLKMRKFTSLKDVSAKNLERIYRLVRNDERR